MELIEKLVNELDAEMQKTWSKYINFHEELNGYRGKPIDDSNVTQINEILKNIQDTFALLYPAYNLIAVRHQYVSNAVTQYNEFIELIEKSGALQDPNQQEKST